MRSRSSCPCCGASIASDHPKVLGGLSSSSSYADIQATWIGVGKSKHFDYYQCRLCGTLSSLYYPDDALLEKLYKSMPPNMEEAVDEADQYQNQFEYAKHIANALKNCDGTHVNMVKLIELGADRGLLAKALAQALNRNLSQVVAIEPNDEVAATLKDTLQQCSDSSRICATVAQLLADKDNINGKYDVIAAIHVLDHTYDPFATLQSLLPLLSQGGVIFLVVHNPKSTVARMLGPKWPAFCAQHPQLFTPNGIRCLARGLGLKVVSQGRTTNHFSLAMLTDFFSLDIPFASSLKLKARLGNRYYIMKGATLR